MTARPFAELPRRPAAWALVGVAALGLAALTSIAPTRLFLVLPFGVAVALMVLRWPSAGALLLVASVPAQDIGEVGPLTATRACLALALGGLAVALLVRRDLLRPHRFVALYVLLLAVMAASMTQSADLGLSAAELARWLIALLALLTFVHFFGSANPRGLLPLLGVVAIIGALEAAQGLAQSALAAGPASFQVGAVTRAYGAFGRPNSYAGYLELTLFPTLWIGVHYLSRVPRALAVYRIERLAGMAGSRTSRARLAWTLGLAGGFLGCAALVLAAVAASFSRGAWLGVASAALLTGLLYARWARLVGLALAPAVVLLLLGGATQILPASASARLSSIVDEARPFDASSIPITSENFAAVERMAHWQAGWHMFEDHPALGVGIGNFNARYPDYFVRTEFRISQGHAHNIYIQMLAETGIAGLTAYLVLILAFMFLALRVVVGAPPGFARMVALGALGTMFSVAVHNVFEDLHVLNLTVQLAAVWTLALAAHRLWRAGQATADFPAVEYSRA